MSLAAKLAEVTAALGFIPKLGTNDAQNYEFVRDADVLNALRKELSSRKVAIVVNVTEQTAMPTGTTTRSGQPNYLTLITGSIEFHDGESDEVFIAEGVGQGLDSGDKGVYKAITGMVKYVLLKMFLVPTGDDPENPREDERNESAGSRTARSGGGTRSTKRDESDPSSAPGAGTPHADSDKVGLSDAQRRMLKARMSKAGLAGQQQVAFAFSVVGKGKTDQMTNEDLNKILLALEDAAKVASIIAEVKPKADA